LVKASAVKEPLSAAGLLPVQFRDAIGFWPLVEIALLMDEVEGRTTVVHQDGQVAHRPGAATAVPPLIPIAPGVLVNPAFARTSRRRLEFPGGWTFPQAKLPEVAATSPTPAPVKFGENEIDLRDLRRLESKQSGYLLTLSGNRTLFIRYKAARALIHAIGLPALDFLQPVTDLHKALYTLGLRDFPFVLLEAESPQALFGKDARAAIANLLWERPRRLARGLAAPDYGTEYRGFYYRPVLSVLNRMGVLDPKMSLEMVAQRSDPMYALYGRVLSEMVGDDRLVTLKDLGFAPQRPDLRQLGTTHPDILVLCEKESLHPEASLLGETFGCSVVVLGGMARWEATEPAADMLRPVLEGRPVRIVHYGDYDPAGWEIADVFVEQLARYDIAARIVAHLVLPQRFSQREIELLAEPIPAGGANQTKLESWMSITHGIDGRPLRIHADHLRPAERVLAAYRE
jgi:hypothetical protein